ncbi:hypothetical protein CROQUDRAFT_202974 [Cronartium quercuum f. sp. fusiforme G11]|uniref:Uncharacterized protein n=1 Tax=Cronartium quercuum f. sp. fusiforme G11 TaxID=708437 RepID=A0A9P6T9Z3_9BASI|nr:hypothetical protein CROQUDRAFT_202974 [Cronartium quercuum f. sp. fusiforme G11]
MQLSPSDKKKKKKKSIQSIAYHHLREPTQKLLQNYSYYRLITFQLVLIMASALPHVITALVFAEPLTTGENHNEKSWNEAKPIITDYYTALGEGDADKASKSIDLENGAFKFNGQEFNGQALVEYIRFVSTNAKYHNKIDWVEAIPGENEIVVKVKGTTSKNNETAHPHDTTLHISKGKITKFDGVARFSATS